ncbi:Hypothetical_protein [Hexamita inflata]|uniref:Hypothetical_protein n=1 Tax=Hexamita inflata TaxID=28002 RepID=A0AA86QD79_9EUKA|nr:Hypothetical protein HINF_LOCUS11175 [Hexamita inflata]CAI9954082.1 Hypothetical protein HINF_LOCUS41727 [Hexamita inflata]
MKKYDFLKSKCNIGDVCQPVYSYRQRHVLTCQSAVAEYPFQLECTKYGLYRCNIQHSCQFSSWYSVPTCSTQSQYRYGGSCSVHYEKKNNAGTVIIYSYTCGFSNLSYPSQTQTLCEQDISYKYYVWNEDTWSCDCQ